MTMAALIESPTAKSQPRSGERRIAHLEILQDLREAEPIWRNLEVSQFSTPYQRFDFLSAWQRHVGTDKQLPPSIIVAFDAQRQPLLLLPLVLGTESGVRVARFMGGKHTTFNMALWQQDFAASATRADLDALVRGIGELPIRIDVLAFTRQPRHWRDLQNPMALLPSQPSANGCPLMIFSPGAPPSARISNSFRRRLKGKERKLETLPGYRYCMASTDTEIKRICDAFFAIKPLRMAAQKLPNVFAETGVESFLRAACLTPLTDGGRAIEVHGLECDAEVIAIFAGVADGHRFSMMFNTYTMSESARYSPGLILMRDIIDHYAGRGYTSLDLGIGSDDYKRLFCKSDEPIFDSYLPLTTRGRMAAIGMSSLARAKRFVKQTPALKRSAEMLRGIMHR
ncbi:CelD/BcsL family acetyltransferase involved in cellulose biosynthesis [Nitrobacter vulgaris]|uniref:GNAT family N-acetyltransferase n=1 Tax=Nitrobacter vulgaris TaxID=29421 RepID=UPI0028635B2F|nr:GNAT family N-acetyltransferase [Nitrobacter vulgaris]MDR6303949.1 CelD/BcsL family acetyltransferase involved in cellulose biosynthesis [Nitrobacter vulgaris]